MSDIRIYLAGPLFTVAEREFNKKLYEHIENEFVECKVDLPQEFAASILGQPKFEDRVFHNCIESINRCDIVIAFLDGPDVDSGTCVEIGYAYANRKPIIGIRTDFRSSEDEGMNLMVSKACKPLIWLKSSSCEFKDVVEHLNKALNDLISLTNPRA